MSIVKTHRINIEFSPLKEKKLEQLYNLLGYEPKHSVLEDMETHLFVDTEEKAIKIAKLLESCLHDCECSVDELNEPMLHSDNQFEYLTYSHMCATCNEFNKRARRDNEGVARCSKCDGVVVLFNEMAIQEAMKYAKDYKDAA